MKKVAVNDFVLRQVKGSGKTYSDHLSFDEIAIDAERQMAKGLIKKGYRDGVIIVSANENYIKKFVCPYVKINENTKLSSKFVQRQPGEDFYIQTRAINGVPLKASNVEYILYRHDVLAENNENTTSHEWELISIHAVPEGVEEMPMGPITMMRNQLERKGGTKALYSSDEWAKSVEFWQKYAPLEPLYT